MLVAQHGRKVRSLEAQGLAPLPFSLSQAVRDERTWEGPTKRSVTFQIEANLSLDPNELGSFMSVHASPEAWLKKHLQTELPMLLSGKDFVDLDRTAIEETKKRLHDKLQRVGAPVGIAVQMFIAEPNLPPIIMDRKLTFTVPNRPPYTMQNVERPLHVEIRVHGTFSKPPPAHLLHPDEKLLEQKLIDAVRDAVGTLVANREADKHLREPSEFSRLNEAIREVVQTTLRRNFEFVCENDDIALIYSDEDLQALTQAILGQEPIKLENILVASGTTSHYDQVPITAVFQTSAVLPETLVSMLAKGYTAGTFREHFTDF